MAFSIQRLATDPSLREQLQRRGLENVQSRFGTDRMMKQYVSLYHEAACRTKR
jgi:glycosyltransferase involved in cell wall biosynthesis